MNVTVPGESSSQVWEEDLEDILNILGQENFDTIHNSFHPSNNTLFLPDDQQCPVLQPDFSEELYPLFHDSQTFPILPFRQEEMQILPVAEVQNTCRPGITVQSNFPVFPVTTQHMEIDETDSGEVASTRALKSPYVMNRAVFGREASSSGENQGKRQARYPDREETGNSSRTSPLQSPKKWSGVLSLILQAFNSPLTAELEECYTGALQKALAEIQAVSVYDTHSQ